jgi:glycerophosphoryl diester phosphodiesterase
LLTDADVLLCFQRPALEEARALSPGLRTCQHVGYGVSIRAARNAWAVGFANSRVTQRGLAAAHALDLVSLVYTVNEPGRMRELDRAGAGGIFTDRPDLARRVLRQPAPP